MASLFAAACQNSLPSVGEATSLPGDTTLQKQAGSGEFVKITNILPF